MKIGQNLELRHDTTGGSGSDTNAALPGDSGGPCYYTDGAGGVIVTGILSSSDTMVSARYRCTQLSGVRAWNASAVLG